MYFFSYLSLVSFFFILSSPHNFLHWTDFINSMSYESGVGLGTYLPFYTRQFTNTVPIFFQFGYILPYVLGWPTLIAALLGFFFLPSYSLDKIKQIIVQVAKLKGPDTRGKSSSSRIWKLLSTGGKLSILTESAKYYDLLRFSLLLSFLPTSFFFAKWTRFIAPSFPLFSLFALLFLLHILSLKKTFRLYLYGVFMIMIIPGLAYLSVYMSPDVRFTASEWIYKNIPANSRILSETANVINLPIPPSNYEQPTAPYDVNSFDFYDLDQSPELKSELSKALNEVDYIIIPSRRIFKNHPKESYPYLADYYDKLAARQLGFKKVIEFSSFPKIELFGKTIIAFPDESAEETWTVFDHPVIRIYKRMTETEITTADNLDFSNYTTTTYHVANNTYRLLVADTPEKWETGLMYVKSRKDIDDLDGMIFTFPESEIRMFWNKNTLSHLTLYWINNKKVVGVSDLPSITESRIITTISSPAPADTVIEIIK